MSLIYDWQGGLAALIYYLLVALGVALAGGRLLQRIGLFAGLEREMLSLLALGFFPALLSLSAFSGVYRAPMLVPLLGVAASLYALYEIHSHRQLWAGLSRSLVQHIHPPLLALFALLALCFVVAEWCYLSGGVNNWPRDQLRGISMTTAIAANHLKPAYPLDLSIPLSYGYYAYSITAFLYSALAGIGWPSVTLMLLGGFAAALFYYSFLRFCALFLPDVDRRWLNSFAILALSFNGLDIFVSPYANNEKQIEWWHGYQITQLSTYWHWLSHYLLAISFGLLGIVHSYEGLRDKRREVLVLGMLFLGLAPFYAVITGLFLLVAGGVSLLAYAAFAPRRDLVWLMQALFRHSPLLAFGGVLLLVPQLFSFVGRDSYLTFRAPTLWMVNVPLNSVNLSDLLVLARRIFQELGPLLIQGVLVLPACIYALWRPHRFMAIFLIVTVVLTYICVSYFFPQTPDWYWRTGGFSVMLLSVLGTLWLLTRFRKHYAACLVVITPLLLPGVYNFSSEQYFRWQSCKPAPEYLRQFNKKLDLHTAVAEVPDFNPSLLFMAGRLSAVPRDDGYTLLPVYRLPEEVLARWFGWQGPALCSATLYGERLPATRYVTVSGYRSNYLINHHGCEE